jgi:predicted DNA-binding transcriptional regulator YafY
MLKASMVYSFKKDGEMYSLFTDSVRSQSEFWLEFVSADGKVEISEKVFSWDEAIGLLEDHNWTKYEMEKMDFSFTDLIVEAKRRSNEGVKFKHYNAQQRVLEILKRLQRNETIIMNNATEEFSVSRAQIQRDIKALNEFFTHSNKVAEYVRGKKGYDLNAKGDFFTIDDALIILLFLYGSRAFNKEELKRFSDKMIMLFSPSQQIKLREFFQSYLYHYKPVQEQDLFELFYTCFQAISQKRILKFTYTNNAGQTREREVIPFTIAYHDRKFYLFARRKGLEGGDPFPWQLDRIENCVITNQKFSLSPDDIKVGEYLQQAFYMYGGNLQKVRLKVKESNIPFLKRQFPVVSINATNAQEWLDVRLEVRGLEGIKLWVLQQGQYVEVLEPMELREKVKDDIAQMYHMYFETSKV